jgi:hypothetical protein
MMIAENGNVRVVNSRGGGCQRMIMSEFDNIRVG